MGAVQVLAGAVLLVAALVVLPFAVRAMSNIALGSTETDTSQDSRDLRRWPRAALAVAGAALAAVCGAALLTHGLCGQWPALERSRYPNPYMGCAPQQRTDTVTDVCSQAHSMQTGVPA